MEKYFPRKNDIEKPLQSSNEKWNGEKQLKLIDKLVWGKQKSFNDNLNNWKNNTKRRKLW